MRHGEMPGNKCCHDEVKIIKLQDAHKQVNTDYEIARPGITATAIQFYWPGTEFKYGRLTVHVTTIRRPNDDYRAKPSLFIPSQPFQDLILSTMYKDIHQQWCMSFFRCCSYPLVDSKKQLMIPVQIYLLQKYFIMKNAICRFISFLFCICSAVHGKCPKIPCYHCKKKRA